MSYLSITTPIDLLSDVLEVLVAAKTAALLQSASSQGASASPGAAVSDKADLFLANVYG